MMWQPGWPIPRALQRALEFVQQPPTGRTFALTHKLRRRYAAVFVVESDFH